ncbi:MAG: aminoacyl-tRNA hydrolase [Anaerolineales bacterium]|nr:aminoacyl-tRNA hydrolase [Anaerolineales bacterium]
MNDIVINEKVILPEGELSWQFTTSGGPGGQHANKAATRVVLRFNVLASPTLQASLSAGELALMVKRLRPRLTSDGELIVVSQESRSQHQNRNTAVAQLQQILAEALIPPKKRRPTRPSRAAKERRLQAKRIKSQRKKERGRDWLEG